MSDNKPKSHVCTLTAEQADLFGRLLEERIWELDTIQYARWRARRNKTTVVAYDSGKCTIQGRDTAEVIEFVLEPLVLQEIRFGYEEVLAAEDDPEMFAPHAGIDESGKGDYFGPLVIACAYVDEGIAQELITAGVQDSKAIKSDKKMAFLAGKIRQATKGRFSVVAIGPEAYNRLYGKFENVNKMLAWGHARALENLLDKVPDCPRAISDQFGRKSTVTRALMEKGKGIKLVQRTKAEEDIAVAAASILARDEFVRRLRRLGEPLEVELPKGASAKVLAVAREIVDKHGQEALGGLAKLHFRTTKKVLGIAE
jgi:ribonuclease HIII